MAILTKIEVSELRVFEKKTGQKSIWSNEESKQLSQNYDDDYISKIIGIDWNRWEIKAKEPLKRVG